MAEFTEEDSQYVNKNFASNQLRTNQIRNKKNSLPQDRQQLYAENIDLKSKVKELIELNMRLKTQLSINQKEKVNLCNMAEEEIFHPKFGNRSQTGHKKSSTNIMSQQQNGQSIFNNLLYKQKQSMAFKKIVRDQNIQLQKLNNQIQRLKKTIKYTRMNEILAENNQLLNQTLRLKDFISEQKENQNRMFGEYANQIDQLRKKFNQQKDSEKKNGFQLKKQLQINSELREKLSEVQSKKIDMEKRFNKELKQYRGEIAQLKSKVFEQSLKSKQCEKEECIKNRKEKNQFKKKCQNNQKQLKKMKDQLSEKIKLINQKGSQIKRAQQLSLISKNSQNKQKTNTIVKKDQNKNVELQSKLTEKKQEKEKQGSQFAQESKSNDKSSSFLTSKANEKVQQPKIQKIITKQQKKLSQKNKETNPVNIQIPLKIKTKNNQSMDTQKLLDSFQLQKQNNLQIQSASLINQKQQKNNKNTAKTVQKYQQMNQQQKIKLVQSDGQYQNLDYDQFLDEEEKTVPTKQKQTKKIEKQNKKLLNEENQQKQKGKIEKEQKIKKPSKNKKQKSTKKLQPQSKKQEQDQQILYSAEKQRQAKQAEGDKEQLKLIRDTLVYKFMAQNYSFQNFCNDINSSDMKEFTITDIMNLLNGQPFLLHEQQIQIIIIYLFDTSQPTGEESLSYKDFIKKMKKFIGKAKAVNQQQESNNIQLLSQIIIKDEKSEGKIRKKMSQLDVGDGSITVEQFKKIMGTFKVKDSLLQTAISQIVYVSQDLNHLNYDFFLKRFLEAQG